MGSTEPLFSLADTSTPRRNARGATLELIKFSASDMGKLAEIYPPEKQLCRPREDAKPAGDQLSRRELNRPLRVGESIEIKFCDQLVSVTITAFQHVDGAKSVCGYRVATLNNRAEQLENGLYSRTFNGFGPIHEHEARAFARQVSCQLISAGETIRWVVTRNGQTYTKEIVASSSWK